MPAARRHRRHSKPPGRRRALELLADASAHGCPAGTLAAAGYGAIDVLGLVREGFASPNVRAAGRHELRLRSIAVDDHRAGARGAGEGDGVSRQVADESEHRNLTKGQQPMRIAWLWPDKQQGKKNPAHRAAK